MTNEEFDKLWEQAESEHYAAEMAAEYPVWRARRRRNIGIAALTLVVGASLPLLQTRAQPGHDNYTVAYCNHTDITDQYWVDMADKLLMEV